MWVDINYLYREQDGKADDLAHAPVEPVSSPHISGSTTTADIGVDVNGEFKIVDSIVSFGHYEQDNNLDNGPEPIEWIVLDVQNEKSLLLSKYALDAKLYNTYYQNVTWETCSLRKWLNEDFLNSAFDGAEERVIATTLVKNSFDEEQASGRKYSKDTEDKVYLLAGSYLLKANEFINKVKVDLNEDGINYFEADPELLTCFPTAYAIEQGVPVSNETGHCGWWMRRPTLESGSPIGTAFEINDRSSSPYVSLKYGVRPAIWVTSG